MNIMIRAAATLLALALASCATVPTAPPTVSLYEAFSGYSAALAAARVYAESPTADRGVVRALARANGSDEVNATVWFARAYVACRGSSAAITPGFDCAGFVFTPQKVSATAIALRSLTTALMSRKE